MTSISGQSLYLPKAVDATVKLLNTKITSVKYVTPTPPPSAPAETLDPTAQKKEAEKLSKISVTRKLIAPFPFKIDHLADAFTKKYGFTLNCTFSLFPYKNRTIESLIFWMR